MQHSWGHLRAHRLRFGPGARAAAANRRQYPTWSTTSACDAASRASAASPGETPIGFSLVSQFAAAGIPVLVRETNRSLAGGGRQSTRCGRRRPMWCFRSGTGDGSCRSCASSGPASRPVSSERSTSCRACSGITSRHRRRFGLTPVGSRSTWVYTRSTRSTGCWASELNGSRRVAAGRLPPEAASAADPDAAVVLAKLSGVAAATISLGRRFPYADSCWLELWSTRGY